MKFDVRSTTVLIDGVPVDVSRTKDNVLKITVDGELVVHTRLLTREYMVPQCRLVLRRVCDRQPSLDELLEFVKIVQGVMTPKGD